MCVNRKEIGKPSKQTNANNPFTSTNRRLNLATEKLKSYSKLRNVSGDVTEEVIR